MILNGAENLKVVLIIIEFNLDKAFSFPRMKFQFGGVLGLVVAECQQTGPLSSTIIAGLNLQLLNSICDHID